MSNLEFTDQELRVLLIIFQKVDPAELMGDLQTIKAKLSAYAQERVSSNGTEPEPAKAKKAEGAE